MLDPPLTPPSNPRCGKCNYTVHGLPTTVCPECGSDLSVVGVRRSLPTSFAQSLSVRTLMIGSALLWFAAVNSLLFLATSVFGEPVVPLRARDGYTFAATPDEWGASRELHVSLDAKGTWVRWHLPGSGRSPAYDSVFVSVSDPDRAVAADKPRLRLQASADSATVTATLVDSGGNAIGPPVPFDADAVATLYAKSCTGPVATTLAGAPSGASTVPTGDRPLNPHLADITVTMITPHVLTPGYRPIFTGAPFILSTSYTPGSSTPLEGKHPVVVIAVFLIVAICTFTTRPLVHRWHASRNRQLTFPVKGASSPSDGE